jgi:hypothetical protein
MSDRSVSLGAGLTASAPRKTKATRSSAGRLPTIEPFRPIQYAGASASYFNPFSFACSLTAL